MIYYYKNKTINGAKLFLAAVVVLSLFCGGIEIVPIQYMMGLFAVILFVATMFLLKQSPPFPVIVILLIFYFFFPYESVNPEVRVSGEYFSIYRRILGPFSTWHVILFWGLAIVVLQRAIRGSWRFRGFTNLVWTLLLAFYGFMLLWGFLHVRGNVLSYGYTDLMRPFVSFQVIGTMYLVYFITVNAIMSQVELRFVINLLKTLFAILVLYGVVRAVLIFAGVIKTTWVFGLPIILYDQMVLLYLALAWGWAEFLLKSERPAIPLPVILLSILLILISTRRFNYVLLMMTLFLTILLCKTFIQMSTKTIGHRLLPVIGLLVVVGIGIAVLVPEWVESIIFSIKSINFLKNSELITNSDVRRFALLNLFKNLSTRPYAWITGFGLGTTWKAIGYQPLDVTYLSVNADYLLKSMGWIPQFSLPYLSLFFRYGIVGAFGYWFLCLWLIKSFYNRLKKGRLPSEMIPLALGSLVFILLFISTIGDGFNPTAAILTGILVGLLERMGQLFPVYEKN